MSKSGLLVVVAVLALCAAWAGYAQSTGPAAGTPSPGEQAVACTTPTCGPEGCAGDCTACPDCTGDCAICPGCPDDCRGACDKADACTKHADVGCDGHNGCGGCGGHGSGR